MRHRANAHRRTVGHHWARSGADDRVTVSTSDPAVPPSLTHVTVTTLLPTVSAILGTDHDVVPTAAPAPPRLFVHVQAVTVRALAAVPASVVKVVVAPALNVVPEVGAVMVVVTAACAATTTSVAGVVAGVTPVVS